MLFWFKVDAGEFGGDVGVGRIGFDEAFVVCKVIVFLIKALLLVIEEFEGGRSFFPLVTASPVFDYFCDTIRHWERSNCARFLDNSGIYVEDLVRALEVAGGTKENAREHACLHCVGDDWIFVGFDVRSKGGFAVFVEIELTACDYFARGVFVQDANCGGEAVEPKDQEVDEVDEENLVREVRDNGVAVLLDYPDVAFDLPDMFAGCCHVDFDHVNNVLHLIKFLVHHD